MASQTHVYLDVEFTTNKKIEGTTLVVDWFASGVKSDSSTSEPVAPTETERLSVSFQQGFDLLV